jgi:hypothetical protein
MKKKIIQTDLLSLFGKKDASNHVFVGRKFWYYFASTSNEFLLTQKNLLRFTITHIRSGVYFYTLDDVPEVEFHCEQGSAIGLLMIVDELDPIKEMSNWNADLTKYRFDDRITKIINFDNSDIDIPEDYYFI